MNQLPDYGVCIVAENCAHPALFPRGEVTIVSREHGMDCPAPHGHPAIHLDVGGEVLSIGSHVTILERKWLA